MLQIGNIELVWQTLRERGAAQPDVSFLCYAECEPVCGLVYSSKAVLIALKWSKHGYLAKMPS